ncbi:MAG: hypothetical protein A9183_03065 [Dehalococcoides mccartyi]|uniref:phage tail tube protein n=1 Tax=Dehalococcoides mccartyi TaxID=61435 RepID=UPI0008051654|nr:phage tail tube protein [Dehalococcoides mccartyi]OBW61099.1 MAG: hypothetical protein A9183_03065 [Dehalococcoides mccartyi]
MTNPVPGTRALRKIQIGLETTPGSVAAATTRFIGTLNMALEQKYNRPEDRETGSLSSYEYSSVVGRMATLPLEGEAYFEQLAYILGMAIKGDVTATGGASPYIWTYLPSLTALNSPDTYSIEYGDDIQAFVSTYCFAKSLEISGTIDEALKFKADVIGQSVEKTTFTTAISNPTSLTPIVVDTGKLYVDTSWANLGNTEKASTIVDFNWKISEGVLPFKALNGSLSYTDRSEKKRHIELEGTFAFNSVTNDLWTNFTAQTPVFARLQFTGPAITGGNSTFVLDGCYVIDSYGALEDKDGLDIVKLKLVSIKDSTSAKEWQAVLTNSLATMP